MNQETQLESVIEKLKLPSPPELAPWLAKLLEHTDSVVIIAIEKPLLQEGPHVGTAWLSAKERLKVRKALLAINEARSKRNEQTTHQIPAK
jgi:hypothetical protein